MAKDVGIAATMANASGIDLPTVGYMAKLWKEAASILGERSDHTEFFKFLETRLGVSA